MSRRPPGETAAAGGRQDPASEATIATATPADAPRVTPPGGNEAAAAASFSAPFAAAQALVAAYFADRVEDPSRGSLTIAGERYILVRAASMSVEFFDLVTSLYEDRGPERSRAVASSVLYDLAHAIGKADALSIHARTGVTDLVTKLSMGPVHFAHSGWASVDILPGSNPVEGDDFFLLYDHPFSFEADAWVRHQRLSTEPVCVMSAGYSSGWCSEAIGQPLVAVEISCIARGDERCRFAMAPPSRIIARLDQVLPAGRCGEITLRAAGLASGAMPELFERKQLEDELRRANEALEARVRERTEALEHANAELATQVEARAKSETVIAEREARTEQALRSVQAGTWYWNLETDELAFSESFEPLFGHESPASGALIASSFLDKVHPEDRSALVLERARLGERGGDVQRELRIRWSEADRAWRWLSLQARVSVGPGGRPIRALGVLMDITERKAAAEARRDLERNMAQAQKLESLGVLAGGIAHDFNNLLVGMLGNAELALADLPPDSPARDLVMGIEHAATRAAELTRQMLAYAGKGRFVVEPLSLNRVITDVADLLGAAISKKASLHFDFSDALPLVEADPTQLRQVAMNLIMNASDALGQGSGAITVVTRSVRAERKLLRTLLLGADLPEGTYVRMEVRDTGAGMDAATQARVFEPFFSTKFTGRGLGLAAALGIVRAHRGAIGVDSVLGAGTTFTLLLPASDKTKEGEHVATRRNTPPAPVAQAGGTVLVVDDDETVREVAHQILERSGLRVLRAVDGRAALAQFDVEGSEVDLVLLDVTMPVMGGAETLAALRGRGWTGPVVLMSGYSLQEANEQFGHLGAAGFVQKPFRRADLVAAVLDRLGSARRAR